MVQRPLGVSAICILGWIGAGFWALAVFAGLGAVLVVVLLALGVVNFVVLFWLWKMQKKGWTWTMVIEIISLVLSLLQFSLVGIVIPAIVVIYLWTKKGLFK